MSSAPTSAQHTPNPALVRADCDCPDIHVVLLMNAISAYSRRLQIYRNRNSGALVKHAGAYFDWETPDNPGQEAVAGLLRLPARKMRFPANDSLVWLPAQTRVNRAREPDRSVSPRA